MDLELGRERVGARRSQEIKTERAWIASPRRPVWHRPGTRLHCNPGLVILISPRPYDGGGWHGGDGTRLSAVGRGEACDFASPLQRM